MPSFICFWHHTPFPLPMGLHAVRAQICQQSSQCCPVYICHVQSIQCARSLIGNRTFRPFDVSPLHWTFRPFTGRFATRTFRPLDVSPFGRFAPVRFDTWTFRPLTGRFAPVCFSMCLLFFRTPERDGRVDRQNFYQYLASVWWHAIKMKTKIITTRFPRTRTEKFWLLCH